MKRFPGRGRETPVGDIYAIVELILGERCRVRASSTDLYSSTALQPPRTPWRGSERAAQTSTALQLYRLLGLPGGGASEQHEMVHFSNFYYSPPKKEK